MQRHSGSKKIKDYSEQELRKHFEHIKTNQHAPSREDVTGLVKRTKCILNSAETSPILAFNLLGGMLSALHSRSTSNVVKSAFSSCIHDLYPSLLELYQKKDFDHISVIPFSHTLKHLAGIAWHCKLRQVNFPHDKFEALVLSILDNACKRTPDNLLKRNSFFYVHHFSVLIKRGLLSPHAIINSWDNLQKLREVIRSPNRQFNIACVIIESARAKIMSRNTCFEPYEHITEDGGALGLTPPAIFISSPAISISSTDTSESSRPGSPFLKAASDDETVVWSSGRLCGLFISKTPSPTTTPKEVEQPPCSSTY